MKFEKLQKDLITMFYKCNENKIFYNVTEDEKEVHITTDGYILHIVPASCFWLDLKKFTRCRRLDTTKVIPENIEEYRTASYTGVTFEHNKMRLAKLQAEDADAFINTELLKKYYDINNLQFKIISYFKPVLIYENNTLWGLIMPVRVSEEERARLCV